MGDREHALTLKHLTISLSEAKVLLLFLMPPIRPII